jgi:hypothetical protein
MVLLIFVGRKTKYNSKKYERRRYELKLFQDSSMSSVLNVKRSLRDYFNKTLKSKSNIPSDLSEIPKESRGDTIE